MVRAVVGESGAIETLANHAPQAASARREANSQHTVGVAGRPTPRAVYAVETAVRMPHEIRCAERGLGASDTTPQFVLETSDVRC